MNHPSSTRSGNHPLLEAEGITRRKFLATAAGSATAGLLAKNRSIEAAAPMAGSDPTLRLAIEGGAPVRPTELRANFPGPLYYDQEERREVLEVLDGRSPFRWYGIGPAGGSPNKCNLFEKELAVHQGTKYCLAVTSGSAALITAVAALEAGPGDEVILPAWTWYSCYNAIVAAGATPVFAEIDDSMHLDPSDIERHITPRTKVIMVVHIMGESADMDPILAVARRHHLTVLEDCAQSMGATYKGRAVGSIGDCGIYSFQVCKTISAGEGGALVTNDPHLFERAARVHDLGLLRDPHAEALGQPPGQEEMRMVVGWQFRMNEFTGGVLRAQLRKLDRIVADFRDRGKRVAEGIRYLPGIQLRKSNDPDGALRSSVYIRTGGLAERDRMISALAAENIPADAMEGSVILPLAPHIERKEPPEANWPSFADPEEKDLHYGAGCCPRTIEIRNRYVGLPMDPKYSDQDVADIIAAVRKVYPAVVKGQPEGIS
ncbi:MAG: DegT/DnrJ/EryC1/StrS family aminotransferase [Terriglobia bacterium]|jgi:8-amino-3,8-dideoxy-alpha-D-manno-octulosonate transaminase